MRLTSVGQTVWVQDVPKLPSPVAADPKKEDFASAMVRVLHGVNVAPALVNFLSNDVRSLTVRVCVVL